MSAHPGGIYEAVKDDLVYLKLVKAAEVFAALAEQASAEGWSHVEYLAAITAAKTIRKRRAGILAAVRLGVNNARHEGLNRRVRLIVNRAYGFHSANAALGLIMLTLGPIEHVLPHERRQGSDP